jgi:two-component system chemotaxis response regulator CheB
MTSSPQSRRPASIRDLLVIGASAGGIEAVCRALGNAGPLDAAVLIVIHLSPRSRTALPEILARATRIPTRLAEDGCPIQRGTMLMAPPDRHMTLDDMCVRLSSGPPENRSRPAVDPLFRSAARFHGPRTVAVVLSGMLADGAAGLRAVRRAGGLAVVQDPADAAFPGMPTSALEIAGADHVVRCADMRATLECLFAGHTEAAAPGESVQPEGPPAPPGSPTSIRITTPRI